MKNIFVGNLSFNATEGAVRTMFEEFGTVDRVNIVTDRDTGKAEALASWKWAMTAREKRPLPLSTAVTWTAGR